MKNRVGKAVYLCLDLIFSAGQIGGVIMAIYKFVIMMESITTEPKYSIEALAAPIAAWFFVAGFASLLLDKIDTIRGYIDYDNIDEEYESFEEE